LTKNPYKIWNRGALGALGVDYLTIGLLAAVLSVVISVLGIVVSLVRSVNDLRERLARVEDKLNWLMKDFMVSLIERLNKRGIIEDVDAWKMALRGIVSTATNPLTEAERRILELVDKGEDLTPEEADELLRLARKLYDEYREKDPENAMKALYYAAAIRGKVYGKYGKKLVDQLLWTKQAHQAYQHSQYFNMLPMEVKQKMPLELIDKEDLTIKGINKLLN
jgi:hypothetical protein